MPVTVSTIKYRARSALVYVWRKGGQEDAALDSDSRGAGLDSEAESELTTSKLKPHRATFAMNLKLRLQLQ